MTLAIQDSIASFHDNVIIFICHLEDVRRVDQKYIAYLQESAFDEVAHLELQCTQEQVQLLMKQKREPWDGFAVIASISEVSRPRFGVSIWVNDEEYSDYETLLGLPNAYVLRGSLIDMVHVTNLFAISSGGE